MIYKASFINYTNTNLNRFLLYKQIYEYICNNNTFFINRNLIFDFGIEIGLSRKQINDEIVGCLYAPFLREVYYGSELLEMTYNGYLRFKEFFTYGNQVEKEVPLLINFDDKIVFRRYHTDCISDKQITYLKEKKWSLNKSKRRFMFKTDNYFSYINIIEDTLRSLQVIQPNELDYIDLIRKYGTPYANRKNISCNLHSRFWVKSLYFDKYEEMLILLLKNHKMPVDWGGIPISTTDIEKTAKITIGASNTDEIIHYMLEDGIIRFISDNIYTFTSSGYTIIHCHTISKKYLPAIFKRISDNRYYVEIGEDTRDMGFLDEFLKNNMYTYNSGWYTKSADYDEIITTFSKLYTFF